MRLCLGICIYLTYLYLSKLLTISAYNNGQGETEGNYLFIIIGGEGTDTPDG